MSSSNRLGPSGCWPSSWSWRGGSHRAHLVRETGQLGVDEPGRRRVPPGVGLGAHAGGPAAGQVPEPAREVLHARGHEGEPFLEALRLRLWVWGTVRLRCKACSSRAQRRHRAGTLRALRSPLRRVAGRLRGFADGAGAGGPQHEQRQTVLARQLAAGARASEVRAGDVDADPVGGRARPLALSPDEGVGGPGVGPRAGTREPARGRQRRGVGSERGDVLGRPPCHDEADDATCGFATGSWAVGGSWRPAAPGPAASRPGVRVRGAARGGPACRPLHPTARPVDRGLTQPHQNRAVCR